MLIISIKLLFKKSFETRKEITACAMAAHTTLKMQEVDGRRGLGMKTIAAAGAGHSQALLSPDPEWGPKHEELWS